MISGWLNIKLGYITYIIKLPNEDEPRYVKMSKGVNNIELYLGLPGETNPRKSNKDYLGPVCIVCNFKKTSNEYTMPKKPYWDGTCNPLNYNLKPSDYTVLSTIANAILKTEEDSENKKIFDVIIKSCPK